MNRFTHFFIDRPIFASVLSIVIVIVGGLALIGLPIAQYPEIAPPTVLVSAVLSRRQRPSGGRNRGDAYRAGSERRRGYAVHVLSVDQ